MSATRSTRGSLSRGPCPAGSITDSVKGVVRSPSPMSQPAARSANLLGTVGLAVSDRIRSAAEDELGLSGSAPMAIVALSTYLADRPLDEIADAFGITASAVVRLVDRLEGERLVQRHPGPDGRRVAVRLTPNGQRRAQG